jgi:nicotinamidase-related amidase
MTQALVVIDVQNEYVTGSLPIVHPPVEESLAQISASIEAAAAHGIPVVLVRHTETDESDGIFVRGTPAWELHESVSSRPHDLVVDKTLPGSFTGTDLEAWLTEHEVDELTIVGYMTHMCVDTTTRQASHLGLSVTVLDDATGTIDVSEDLPAALVHQVELGVLASGFAQVSSTADWVASLDATS